MRRVLTTAAVIVVAIVAIAGLGASAGAMSAGAVSSRVIAPASTGRNAQTGDKPRRSHLRFNEDATHSPELERLLAGRAVAPSAAARARPAALASSASTVEGIDVASFQHPKGAAINWTQVAQAAYKFAFIKVSEGSYYTNPYYAGGRQRRRERRAARRAVRVRHPELLRRRAPG